MSLASIVSKIHTPPLSHRFSVFFQGSFLPTQGAYGQDILFQKVSGLSMGFSHSPLYHSSNHGFTVHLPEKVDENRLVLERGLTLGSGLSWDFRRAMTEGKFTRTNVLITLLDDPGIPRVAWLVRNAIPVKWSFSDLDANADEVMIETLELSYSHFKTFSP